MSQATRESADGRRLRRLVLVLVLAALVAAAAWVLIWSGTWLGHGWSCRGDRCTGEGIGSLFTVVVGVVLVLVLRLFGLALGIGPSAAVAGWSAAVADGRLPAETVSGYVGFWLPVAILGAVLALIGLFVEVRQPGPVWRLFGWVPVPAGLGEYTGPRHGPGTAVATSPTGTGLPGRQWCGYRRRCCGCTSERGISSATRRTSGSDRPRGPLPCRSHRPPRSRRAGRHGSRPRRRRRGRSLQRRPTWPRMPGGP